MTSHSKIVRFNWECIGFYTYARCLSQFNNKVGWQIVIVLIVLPMNVWLLEPNKIKRTQTQGRYYCLHRRISSACNNNLEVFHLTFRHARNKRRSKHLSDTFNVALWSRLPEVLCSSGCWWALGINCGSNRLSPLEAAGNINLFPFSCSRVQTDRQLSPEHDVCYCQLSGESALGVPSSVIFSCMPSQRFVRLTFNFWTFRYNFESQWLWFRETEITAACCFLFKSLIRTVIYRYHTSKLGKFAVNLMI
jgi:hypothetical protein